MELGPVVWQEESCSTAQLFYPIRTKQKTFHIKLSAVHLPSFCMVDLG